MSCDSLILRACNLLHANPANFSTHTLLFDQTAERLEDPITMSSSAKEAAAAAHKRARADDSAAAAATGGLEAAGGRESPSPVAKRRKTDHQESQEDHDPKGAQGEDVVAEGEGVQAFTLEDIEGSGSGDEGAQALGTAIVADDVENEHVDGGDAAAAVDLNSSSKLANGHGAPSAAAASEEGTPTNGDDGDDASNVPRFVFPDDERKRDARAQAANWRSTWTQDPQTGWWIHRAGHWGFLADQFMYFRFSDGRMYRRVKLSDAGCLCVSGESAAAAAGESSASASTSSSASAAESSSSSKQNFVDFETGSGSERLCGRVLSWKAQKNFGFIAVTDAAGEIQANSSNSNFPNSFFCHANELDMSGRCDASKHTVKVVGARFGRRLHEGESVTFEVDIQNAKVCAARVRL